MEYFGRHPTPWFYYNKNNLSSALTSRLHRAVFFILNSPKKENTDTDNARVAMPCKSAMNMAQKKARP
ncbi:hypothetical protein NEN82_17125, partial [Escherichia coli]|nr:hypothetical protein [Escherichia coli]